MYIQTTSVIFYKQNLDELVLFNLCVLGLRLVERPLWLIIHIK